MQSGRNLLLLCVALAFLVLSSSVVVSQTPEESDQFAKRFILRALELLEAPVSDCAPEVFDRYAGVQPICASFRGSFSSLKFGMESDLRRMEFAALAEPLDAWVLRDGIYHREFKVSETLVTADFDEGDHSIVVTYGGELPAEPPSEKEADDGDPQTTDDGE